MKFGEYIINEDKGKPIEDAKKLASLIKKDCKPYLALLKGKEPLVRGMTNYDIPDGIKKVIQERRPRIFPKRSYGNFNMWLQANGGARRDKSVIALAPYKRASRNKNIFGLLHWIFPIGNIKYSWFHGNDINWGIDGDIPGIPKAKYEIDPEDIYDYFSGGAEESDLTNDEMKKIFGNGENFDYAYKNHFEIWVECKKYYYSLMGQSTWSTSEVGGFLTGTLK